MPFFGKVRQPANRSSDLQGRRFSRNDFPPGAVRPVTGSGGRTSAAKVAAGRPGGRRLCSLAG
jgi:hypothetical protein